MLQGVRSSEIKLVVISHSKVGWLKVARGTLFQPRCQKLESFACENVVGLLAQWLRDEYYNMEVRSSNLGSTNLYCTGMGDFLRSPRVAPLVQDRGKDFVHCTFIRLHLGETSLDLLLLLVCDLEFLQVYIFILEYQIRNLRE